MLPGSDSGERSEATLRFSSLDTEESRSPCVAAMRAAECKNEALSKILVKTSQEHQLPSDLWPEDAEEMHQRASVGAVTMRRKFREIQARETVKTTH